MRLEPLPQPQKQWDYRWANNVVRRLNDYFKSLAGDVEAQSRLISHKGRRINVTDVTTAPYTVLKTDDYVNVAISTSAASLTLPVSPDQGQRHYIADAGGAAGTNTISILPHAGGTVNSGTVAVTITDNYGARNVVYNGTQWIATGK